MTKMGPKKAVTAGPLDLSHLPPSGGARAVAFIEEYVIVPKGKGAGKLMRLRPWQREIVHGLFDDPRPRQGVVVMPRGNGKSGLASALAVYGLFGEPVEGSAQVICVASTEAQAKIVYGNARRMIELNEELASRAHIFIDKVVVPETGSELFPLPAIGSALQGYDPTLAVVDELHVVKSDVWSAMLHAAGKREHSLLLAISTPAGSLDCALWQLTELGRAGTDPSLYFREWSAPDGCDITDEAMWAVANPALGDFFFADGVRAALGKSSESDFRRYRLAQWSQADDCWMPRALWEACRDPKPQRIRKGRPVVIGFDGSVSADATAIVAVEVPKSRKKPARVEIVALWEKKDSDRDDWRVPKRAVENEIRRACQRYRVVEIACDTAWFAEMFERLEEDGLPVVKYPQSAARMAEACGRLFDAVADRRIVHDGDPALNRHMFNAVAKVEARGTRIVKQTRKSTRFIDAAVALVMAYDRAAQMPDDDYDVVESVA